MQLEIEKCYGGYKVEAFDEDPYIFVTLPEAFEFMEKYFADGKKKLKKAC